MISTGNGAIIHEPSNIHAGAYHNPGDPNWHDGEIRIGEHTYIQPFVSIIGKRLIEIGRECSIAPGTQIYDHDHNLEDVHRIQEDGNIEPVRIGNYCWIGANAVILKGVELADYCVVGAGAVVTHSFPEGSIIVGNPARLLRKRNICTNTHN